MTTTVLQPVDIAHREHNESLEVPASHLQHRKSHQSRRVSKQLVLAAASGIILVAVGIPNTFGVFQNYFESSRFTDVPPSRILLIGSLASSLYMILGAATGRLADWWGHETSVVLGSALMIGSLFVASISTEFYQLVLSQGVMFGVGAAFAYYPAVTTSRLLFSRHGLANGIVVSGGALGGCVLPYPTRLLLARYGLSIAFRVLGGVAAAVLLPANFILLHNRRAVSGLRSPLRGKIINLALLRDSRFLVMLVAGTTAMIGFLPRYFLITPSAIASGIDANFAAWLLGLMNGLSIVGRLGIGMFADRYGKLTALTLSFVLCGLGHLVFWLPGVLLDGERAVALMTVFVVFVGLLGSGFVSLIPVVTADVFGDQELASKIGLLNSAMGLGAFAGPSMVYTIISGGQNWSMGVLFPGLLMVLGGLGMTRMRRYI
jgi:MFS family permease